MKLWIVSFTDQYSTNRYVIQSETKPEIDLSLEEIEFGFTVDVGEPLTAHLNAVEAQDISTRLTAAAFDTVNDMFLYGYFMMIIRQNQPDMPEESKHQLASKQVVNIRQFRKSMEEAAAAAILHDTAIPA